MKLEELMEHQRGR